MCDGTHSQGSGLQPADQPDHVTGPRPGLLVEWRNRGQGWEGRVIYVAALEAGVWTTVEQWIPADALQEVGGAG